MMRRVAAAFITAVGLLAAVVSTHHSYAATYDTAKDVKLEGKLVQFVYRNPHTFVDAAYRTVKDASTAQNASTQEKKQ